MYLWHTLRGVRLGWISVWSSKIKTPPFPRAGMRFRLNRIVIKFTTIIILPTHRDRNGRDQLIAWQLDGVKYFVGTLARCVRTTCWSEHVTTINVNSIPSETKFTRAADSPRLTINHVERVDTGNLYNFSSERKTGKRIILFVFFLFFLSKVFAKSRNAVNTFAWNVLEAFSARSTPEDRVSVFDRSLSIYSNKKRVTVECITIECNNVVDA